MRDPVNPRADHLVVRDFHAHLRRVIHLLLLTMMTTMPGGAALSVLQAWLAAFNRVSLVILLHFGLGNLLIVRSAYRSPEHNRAVGDAAHSKHLHRLSKPSEMSQETLGRGRCNNQSDNIPEIHGGSRAALTGLNDR